LNTFGQSNIKKYNLHINSHIQQEKDGQLFSAWCGQWYWLMHLRIMIPQSGRKTLF